LKAVGAPPPFAQVIRRFDYESHVRAAPDLASALFSDGWKRFIVAIAVLDLIARLFLSRIARTPKRDQSVQLFLRRIIVVRS
jgi:hypothetical protein